MTPTKAHNFMSLWACCWTCMNVQTFHLQNVQYLQFKQDSYLIGEKYISQMACWNPALLLKDKTLGTANTVAWKGALTELIWKLYCPEACFYWRPITWSQNQCITFYSIIRGKSKRPSLSAWSELSGYETQPTKSIQPGINQRQHIRPENKKA